MLPCIDFHQGTLRLRGLDAIAEALIQPYAMTYDPRQECWQCDAMHALPLLRQIEEMFPGAAQEFRDSQLFTQIRTRIAVNSDRLPRLRPDQVDAIEAFDSHGRRGLVVMPTGTGKTLVAISLLARYRLSTLIVVPVRDLMYQWHSKILELLGVDAGLIGDGVHRVSAISVTTYESAAIHMPRIGHRFGLLIFDEVHHLAGPWRSDAARMALAPLRLGLTATLPTDPQRLETLQHLVGPTVYRQAIEQATGTTLAKYTIQRIAVKMDAQEELAYRQYGQTIQQFVRERREQNIAFQWDDTYKLAADTTSDPKLARQAAETLRAFRAKRKIEEQANAKFRVLEDLFRLHVGEPVLVFTGSNVMARQISLRFLIPCLLSHCAKRERQDLLRGFAEHRYPVLVANRVLDEGVDLPEVKIAIVLGGLASTRQATQRLGRVLRRGASGQRATLYEIVTDDSNEVQRSRKRRRTAAYQLKNARPTANRSTADRTAETPALFFFEDAGFDSPGGESSDP